MHIVPMIDCGPLTFCFCLLSLLLLVYAYSYCVDLSKKIYHVAVYYKFLSKEPVLYVWNLILYIIIYV